MPAVDTVPPSATAPVAVVTTTVGSEADAARQARGAVQARRAACVQVERITSHYVWKGQQCEEPEWRLVCKTLPTAVPALLAWLREAHGYEVPQLLVRTELAAADYADWVAQQVDGGAERT